MDATPIADLNTLVAFLWTDGARLLRSVETSARLISGKFSSVDRNGRTVTDADYKSRCRLVLFGYTRCPDVFPGMLDEVADIMDRFGSDIKKIVPLFVSIDSERDNSAVVKEFVLSFYTRMIGLTGSAAQLKDAAQAFRGCYVKTEETNNTTDCLVDHSVIVFPMDDNGGFAAVFSHSTDTKIIVTEIRQRL